MIAVILAAALALQGGSWRFVGAAEDLTLALDTAAMRMQGAKTIARNMVVFRQPDQGARYVLEERLWDCGAKTSEIRKVEFFDDAGQLVDRGGARPPAAVEPGTFSDRLMQAVCNRKFDGEVSFATQGQFVQESMRIFPQIRR